MVMKEKHIFNNKVYDAIAPVEDDFFLGKHKVTSMILCVGVHYAFIDWEPG